MTAATMLAAKSEIGMLTPAETAAENAAPKEEKPSGGKNDWMKQYL